MIGWYDIVLILYTFVPSGSIVIGFRTIRAVYFDSTYKNILLSPYHCDRAVSRDHR